LYSIQIEGATSFHQPDILSTIWFTSTHRRKGTSGVKPVVKYSPNYPKVKGLNPASTRREKREKKCHKSVEVPQPSESLYLIRGICHYSQLGWQNDQLTKWLVAQMTYHQINALDLLNLDQNDVPSKGKKS
jgi:hypothetical protein